MSQTERLWKSKTETEWRSVLDRYWGYVKPSHLKVEKEFDSLDSNTIKEMDAEQWYDFLLYKYFYWKYTAPNRYRTTTIQLKKYLEIPDGLNDLNLIKKSIFSFDKNDILKGLQISKQIKGLGTAGASGLLAVLFPSYFATVDQFAVKALSEINDLAERPYISSINPDQIKIKEAVLLIKIMKEKAKFLNVEFKTNFWTPRKVDMVLWIVAR